jgi:AcrR family transcriptional regulator
MATTSVRRSSYGAGSPVVGERGARTRQQILDVTLDLLAERGFYDLLIEDIAQAAGISRATLYQYFESKDEIFIELLAECGSALMRVVRRLGPLGPTAEQFDNLHWWLGEWAWVYDKYATMFTEWAHADSRQTPLGPLIGDFVELYASRVATRLESSGVEGVDAVNIAKAILVVVHRFNYFRHSVGRRQLSDEELLGNLAVIVQLVIFPQTPVDVLASQGVKPAPARSVAAWGGAKVDSRRDRFEGLSERAMDTIHRLLEAGCRTFATLNYRSAKIDDIVAEAGLARGTFYKYFENKLDLMAVLSEEVREKVLELAPRFASIPAGPQGHDELKAFLREFVAVHARYEGVFRAWVEREPADEVVQVLGREAGLAVQSAVITMLQKVERPYVLDLNVASLVMLCVLERMPDVTTDWVRDMAVEEIVDTMSSFIERGLMNGTPA